MHKENSFTVELIEDVVTGELLLPVPESIISERGWFEGTVLVFDVEGSEIIIREHHHDYWFHLSHLC